MRENAGFPKLHAGASLFKEPSMPASTDDGGNKTSFPNLRGVRVLVVEDQWHVAHALKSLLDAEGMEVCGLAPNLTDARRLVAAQRPDLAIVDINLKGEMAYVLIGELHEQRIRVVVASGYAFPQRFPENVAAVLQKPFNGPELLAALQRALAFDVEG
jgi:DNA-binding response OmpR family regulator